MKNLAHTLKHQIHLWVKNARKTQETAKTMLGQFGPDVSTQKNKTAQPPPPLSSSSSPPPPSWLSPSSPTSSYSSPSSHRHHQHYHNHHYHNHHHHHHHREGICCSMIIHHLGDNLMKADGEALRITSVLVFMIKKHNIIPTYFTRRWVSIPGNLWK